MSHTNPILDWELYTEILPAADLWKWARNWAFLSHTKSKGCSSLRATQLEENASFLYNQKLFYTVVQNLLPMTFGEFKTQQNKQKFWDTDAIKLSASKTYFLSPPSEIIAPISPPAEFRLCFCLTDEKLLGIDYITDI